MAVATTTLKGLHSLNDRIRRMVDPAAVIANDDVVEAFNEYEEAIREANDRLRECDELLRDGHRAQALQHCEHEPDLLQVVGHLDFPERPLWHAVLQDAGFTPPPAVMLDVAAELNEAYNLEKPLTDLMRAHRLHALAGSPLKTRLGYLRKIAERDSTNPIWGEDLRTYERARQRQIEQELLVVERARDADQAAQLERELATTDWDEAPPKALVETAARVHAQLRQARARAKLRELAGQLHDALGARDVAQARQYRQTWNAQAAIAHLPTSDPLFEQIEPVFDWLDRNEAQRQKEHNHKSALAALEQALDAGVGRIELERSYNEVSRFGAVPDALNRKVQLRVEYIERRTRMRWISGVVVALALIGVCAGGMAWYAHRIGQEQDAQQRIKSLAKLVDEQKQLDHDRKELNVAPADKELSELKEKFPVIYVRPEIKPLEADLQNLHRLEDDRINGLEQSLTRMQGHLEKGAWRDIDQGIVEISGAEKLCRSEGERSRVKTLENALRVKDREYQAEVNQEFQKKLGELTQRIERLQYQIRSAPSPDNDRKALEQLLTQANELKRTPRVSIILANNVEPLIQSLNTEMNTIAVRKNEREALDRLRSGVTNLNAFASALERYAKDNSTQSRSATFTELLRDEQTLWRSVEAWNQLVRQWSNQDFRKVSPAEAKTYLEQLEKFAPEHGEFPDNQRLQALVNYLKAVQNRVEADGKRIDQNLAEGVLTHPLITLPRMLIEKVPQNELRRYYLVTPAVRNSDPKSDGLNAGDWAFYPYPDQGLGRPRPTATKVKEANIDNPPARGGGFDWRSPQDRFAESAQTALQKLRLDKTGEMWEEVFVGLLGELNQSPTDKTMEPIVRLFLIDAVLDTACQGSYCLRQAFEPWSVILEGAAAGAKINVNWIDPDTAEGKTAREQASKTLARLPLPGISAAVDNHRRSLDKMSRGAAYRFVGCLLKDTDDQWKPEWRLPKDAAGSLVLLRKEGNKILAREVGTAAGGVATLASSASDGLREGQPVFLAERALAVPGAAK